MPLTSATCAGDTGRFVLGHESSSSPPAKRAMRHHFDGDFDVAAIAEVPFSSANCADSFLLAADATAVTLPVAKLNEVCRTAVGKGDLSAQAIWEAA